MTEPNPNLSEALGGYAPEREEVMSETHTQPPKYIATMGQNFRCVVLTTPDLPAIPLDELERLAIEQTLARLGQNRTHAAKALGISVRTLQRKLAQWHGHTTKQARPARQFRREGGVNFHGYPVERIT